LLRESRLGLQEEIRENRRIASHLFPPIPLTGSLDTSQSFFDEFSDEYDFSFYLLVSKIILFLSMQYNDISLGSHQKNSVLKVIFYSQELRKYAFYVDKFIPSQAELNRNFIQTGFTAKIPKKWK
jgi:hypothetical protein